MSSAFFSVVESSRRFQTSLLTSKANASIGPEKENLPTATSKSCNQQQSQNKKRSVSLLRMPTTGVASVPGVPTSSSGLWCLYFLVWFLCRLRLALSSVLSSVCRSMTSPSVSATSRSSGYGLFLYALRFLPTRFQCDLLRTAQNMDQARLNSAAWYLEASLRSTSCRLSCLGCHLLRFAGAASLKVLNKRSMEQLLRLIVRYILPSMQRHALSLTSSSKTPLPATRSVQNFLDTSTPFWPHPVTWSCFQIASVRVSANLARAGKYVAEQHRILPGTSRVLLHQ